MERYSEYKDSGVQWLGMIPEHWKMNTLRKHLSFVSIKNHADAQLLSVTREQGVIVRDTESKEENHNFIPDDLSGYKFVEPGDFCINKMKSWQGSYGVSDYEGIVSPAYFICKLSGVDKSFFSTAIRSRAYIPFFAQHSKGIRVGQWDLSPIALMSIPFFLPPFLEQQAIVTYLDDKCGKIDKLVAGKERELELLQEMKQRIIADAVTRGLPSLREPQGKLCSGQANVKMKPTGISWLPQIPEHWEMSKVSSHFRQRNEKVSDQDYPALSVSKMGVTPQLENVALSNAEGNSRKLVKVGDYAVNSRSDRKGSCGVSQYEGSVSLITIVLEPRNIDGGYVHFLFRSTPWIEEFYRNGRGIVADLWTTNYQMMKGMYLPLPPIEEQKAIVSYINGKVATIDTLSRKLRQEIEGIKEYRQRLISDVVTGQIKVC